MWSSQLLALLGKREKKKERRHRGSGQASCTFLFAVPKPPFPGAAGWVCGRRRAAAWWAQLSGSWLWDGRVLSAPAPCGGGGQLDRAPLCPVSHHPVAKGRAGPGFLTAQPPLRVSQRIDAKGDVGICPSTPSPRKGDCGQGSFSNKQPLLAL